MATQEIADIKRTAPPLAFTQSNPNLTCYPVSSILTGGEKTNEAAPKPQPITRGRTLVHRNSSKVGWRKREINFSRGL
jgi:hypothetical protein